MNAPQEFPALEKPYDYTSDYYEFDKPLRDIPPWINDDDFDVIAMRRVLAVGITETWDDLFDQLCALRAAAGTPHFEVARALASDQLWLPLSRSEGTAIWLLRRLEVCLIQIVRNMTSERWQHPSCRGEEWALHQILAWSIGSLRADPEQFDQVDPGRLETLIEVFTTLREDELFVDHDYRVNVEIHGRHVHDLTRAAIGRFWFDELLAPGDPPAPGEPPHPLCGPGLELDDI
jgi:hypothetical protein